MVLMRSSPPSSFLRRWLMCMSMERSKGRTTAGFWRRGSSFGRGVLGRAAELIAHAANGFDEIVAALQLLAQVADVHVDGAIEGCGFAVIEILHEGVAGEDAAGGAHQHFE